MAGKLYIDIGHAWRQKSGQDICGDAFKFRRVPGEDRLIAALSDGLGSGVKANILASMTAVMALKFVAGDRDIAKSADIMMSALPICAKRKISYATFTIVDTLADGATRVIEMGNPPFLLLRGGASVDLPRERAESPRWKDRAIDICRFAVRPMDRIVLLSDGVTQAGMGSDKYKLGWRVEACREFVEAIVARNPDIVSAELAETVVREASRKEPGGTRKDDMTCAAIFFRAPRKLLLMTGPPFHKERDAECAAMVANYAGTKALCGGTTASIVGRELDRPVEMDLRTVGDDLPPISRMRGVDLITEGIFTLTKAAEYLETETPRDHRNAAVDLVDLFHAHDIIEFVVGTRINEAHQDPNLPRALDIRRNIVKRLAAALTDRHLKETSIRYV